jgi:hypothetical protein
MSDRCKKLVDSVDRSALEELLREEPGTMVFTLRGKSIVTQADFVAAANAALPLDPPLGEGLSWDAFSDSLWSGIDALRAPRVIVAWEHAEVLANAAPTAFDEALRCFREVSDLVCSSESGIDVPTSLRLLLVRGE